MVYKLQKKANSSNNYRSRGHQSSQKKQLKQDSRGYGKNSNDQKDEERGRYSKKNSGDFKAMLNELEKEMSKMGMMGIGFPSEPAEIKVVHQGDVIHEEAPRNKGLNRNYYSGFPQPEVDLARFPKYAASSFFTAPETNSIPIPMFEGLEV